MLAPNGTLNGTPSRDRAVRLQPARDGCGFQYPDALLHGSFHPRRRRGPAARSRDRAESSATFAISQITVSLTATGGRRVRSPTSLTPGAPVVPGNARAERSAAAAQLHGTRRVHRRRHATGDVHDVDPRERFRGQHTRPRCHSRRVAAADPRAAPRYRERPSAHRIRSRSRRTALPLYRTVPPRPSTGQPSGLTLTPGGTLQGTPTATGTFQRPRRADGSAFRLAVHVVLYADRRYRSRLRPAATCPVAASAHRTNQPLSAPRLRVNCNWTITFGSPAGGTWSSIAAASSRARRPASNTNSTFTLHGEPGRTATRSELFRIQIAAAAPQPLSIVTASFTDRTVGGSFSQHAHRAGRHRAVYLVARLRHAPDGRRASE